MGYSNSSSEPSNTRESPVKTRKKFSPIISVRACKGCLICVYACVKLGANVLRESGERTAMGGILPIVDGDCIGCRWCERFCPDFAISVEEVEAC